MTREKMTRGALINMTPSLKADVDAIAAEEGMTASDFMRCAIRKEVNNYKDRLVARAKSVEALATSSPVAKRIVEQHLRLALSGKDDSYIDDLNEEALTHAEPQQV